MIGRRTAICTLLVLSWTASASAQDYKLGALEIATPWTRATPATAKSGGGFVTITNKGTSPDRLIAARSQASLKVEIHEMRMDGQVMRMRELANGLEIPAGATVTLKPGSFHIMFMELKSPLTKDAKVPVTLVFEKAGSIDVDFKVEAIGAAGGGHQMR
ncbi:MAG: copper chaperone PCu(A)C [Rhodospirillales bacterium]|nr:copper chaperone PCu(A)C [Rhodospirillales bacterium]